jgi:hypothetical protein
MTVKRFLQATLSPSPLQTKAPSPANALVVVPSPPPTLGELTADIQKRHNEIESNLLSTVVLGIENGKALIAAKKLVPHGFFEDHIAGHFTFTMGTAQKYMRLARREADFHQLLAQKQSAGSVLTMREALKFLDTLRDKKKPKKKAAKAGAS